MKELKPIRNRAEYQAALLEASIYFDKPPELGTKKADRFEILLMLIESYEAKEYPISPPDPIEAIKFRMEQANLKPKDLKPMIGELNRVYEVLSKKRRLTLSMIRRLHTGLGIPAESLIAWLFKLRKNSLSNILNRSWSRYFSVSRCFDSLTCWFISPFRVIVDQWARLIGINL